MFPLKSKQSASITQLGRYEVITSIGSGGMATIYLARIAGPAGFEKPVALKVIHSHLSEDPQFVQMFFDEARLAAQLQHPNIVQIFELGEAETEGMFYIAMEYLRGETLGSIIQRVFSVETRGMDARIACHIIQQACDGLHYAHEATTIDDRPIGLVHRDISPQNLFITYSGSVKLMDFGIARAEGTAHSTRPGSLKGKFSYMSPEQVGGRDIDRRSDIFALGVVFWELLTGRRLFKGSTDLESLRFVEECKVPPVGSLRPGVPSAIDTILSKVLAKDPADRYQTALDLHHDIGLVADKLGSPITTHELAQRMRTWFTKEVTVKKRLLTRTLLDVPLARPDPEDDIRTTIEETPSISEPSGIRLRDLEILQLSGEQTTPSHPEYRHVPAPPRVPTQPAAAHPEEIPDAPTIRAAPPRAVPEIDPTGEERITQPPGSNALVWVALSGAALLVGVLVFLVVLLAPSLDPPDPAPRRIDPRLISSDPLVDESTPMHPDFPPQTPVPAPDPTLATPQGAGSDTPTIEIGAGAETNVGAAAEGSPFVTLTLTIRPRRATVLVNGEVQEDPARIRLPRGTEPVVVLVRAPQYQQVTFRVTPDQNVERSVSLHRAGSPPVQDPPGPRDREDLVSNPYRPR